MRPNHLAFLGTVAILCACASQPVPPARPPLQDEFLDRLTGEWDIARSIRGEVLHNRASARWVLGHQFVELDMTDVRKPPAYEAIVLVGYDSERKRYVAHWCDSFGGGYSADGFGVRKDNSIEFRFEYPDGPFFNTFTWDPVAGTWRCRGENGQPDGSRKVFMEDLLTRR